MGKITYRDAGAPTFNVKVYLDGQYAGTIMRNGRYWLYQPKGRTNPPGESLYSVEAVKRSLEK
jgi:hypothetical protein